MNYYHLQQRFLGNAHGTLDPEIQEYKLVQRIPTGILVSPAKGNSKVQFAITDDKINNVTVSPAESSPSRFDQHLHTIVPAKNKEDAQKKAKQLFQEYYESIKDQAAEYQMKVKLYTEKESPELW